MNNLHQLLHTLILKRLVASLVLAVLMILPLAASAQRDNVNLLAQSPDGRTVRLVWFVKMWNSDITGFDVKRKDGLQDWVKLNKAPIVPEISLKEKISVVESDKNEESRVRAKLFKMVSAGKISEISNADLMAKLNSDAKTVQDLSDKIAHDYDLALIEGFGFVDRSVTMKTNYEYGVFIQGTNILLDSVLWNYGQIPNLDVVTEITSRSTEGKGIELIWNVDESKMKSGYVAGFNLYRQGIRLNNTPVMTTEEEDGGAYAWRDKSAKTDVLNQYSISAESIFGIEGIIHSYTYNPEDHPKEYKKAAVTEIASLGYYNKDGISVKWDFPKDYEKYIKGFYVEKNNMPAGYVTVSGLLDTSAASFIDKTPSPVSSYVSYRVRTVYSDRTKVQGMERIYSYFPLREPPAPQDFTGSMTRDDQRVNISLKWSARMAGDTATDFYRVYFSDTINGLFNPVSANPVRADNYAFSVERPMASVYRCYVIAVGKNKTESRPTDTLSFTIPSYRMPKPQFTEAFIDSGAAVIKWTYPFVQDLKGFRLFQNDTLLAGEDALPKTTSAYKTGKLAPGESFTFRLQAISDGGVVSDSSAAATLVSPGRRR